MRRLPEPTQPVELPAAGSQPIEIGIEEAGTNSEMLTATSTIAGTRVMSSTASTGSGKMRSSGGATMSKNTSASTMTDNTIVLVISLCYSNLRHDDLHHALTMNHSGSK